MIARRKQIEIAVWTQNLYLGGDIHLGLAARSPEHFRACVDEVYRQTVASDFPGRARRLARELEGNRPDLIALQEVVEVQSRGLRAPGNRDPSGPVVLDYLEILHGALLERGLHYRTACVSTNALLALPGDACGWVRLTDRDVILVSDRLSVIAHGSRHYDTQRNAALGGAAGLQIDFRRGFQWVDVRENTLASPYRAVRLINTHLELVGPEQRAQGRELLAFMAASSLPVLVTGDFNALPTKSDPDRWNPRLTHLTDLWPTLHPQDAGHTFSLLGGPQGGRTRPEERCDVTFCSEHFTPRRMELFGVENGGNGTGKSSDEAWMSDHAGLLSALSLS